MTQSLQGKVAVVTGAANGIGRASALKLAREGADLALLDLDGAGMEGTVREIKAMGRRVETQRIDCTDRRQIETAFKTLRASLGPVDILFNDVGQSAREKMTDFSTADLETVDFLLAVNLKSAMYCSRQVVGEMRERRQGRIINVTSEAALNGAPGCWDYGAAKAGIIGFTRALAKELAPFQITVNCVGPGLTRTRVVDQLPTHIRDQVAAGIPMQVIGEPEDIANAVYFFSSDLGRYVSGQTLLVNGANWFT
jgi:NAD(P)-dependent dehydrogenase (short-subunit alcohol dehydrogenase family)